MSQTFNQNILASLYVINKEAKRLRDLRFELKLVLFKRAEPSSELCEYVRGEGLSFLSADPDELEPITSRPWREQKEERLSLLSELGGFLEEDEIEEIGKAVFKDEAMLGELHGLLRSMRDEKDDLYELKSKVLKRLDLPLVGYHLARRYESDAVSGRCRDGVDFFADDDGGYYDRWDDPYVGCRYVEPRCVETVFALHAVGPYSFHTPVEHDVSEVGKGLLLSEEELPRIKSEADESLSLGIAPGEARAMLEEWLEGGSPARWTPGID